MPTDEDEDDYFVPLVDQRVFGAGIKRKRIAFIPASSEGSGVTQGADAGKRAGDRYLSLVLKNSADINSDTDKSSITTTSTTPLSTCSICGQTISASSDGKDKHDSSIAHQVCLAHSHPPSHLDRSRTGLKYLESYGWDPDARQGLGTQQGGILAPVKAKQKNNTTGIGTESKADEDDISLKRKRRQTDKQQELVKLDAKAVREMEVKKSKRAERLRQSFYGEDLSAYLGPAG